MLWMIDDQILPESEARISPNDLGMLRGLSAFEYMRTYDYTVFHLDDHIQRLFNTCQLIDIILPFTKEELAQKIMRLNEAFNAPNCGIKCIVTGGASKDQFAYEGCPRLLIVINHLQSPPLTLYQNGAIAETVMYERFLPTAKTGNYMFGVLEMGRRQVDEVLYMTSKKEILEGTRSNFFAIKKDVLYTAQEEVLGGVTRKVVLELANELNIPIEFSPPIFDNNFDEAFITSTIKEIMPVVKIDNKPIGNGLVGGLTKRLRQLFSKKVEALKSPPEAILS